MEETLFGQILLDFQLITESDLERCLQIQRKITPPVRLGEILLQEGLINEKTLSSILSVQRQKLDSVRARSAAEPTLAEQLADAGPADYLIVARKLGASDLYLSSTKPPIIRLHSNLVELPAAPIPLERCREMLFSLLTQEQIDEYYAEKSVDATVSLEDVGRCRMNVFRHFTGIGAVFRILPDELMPFSSLGLPEAVCRFAELKGGLVLSLEGTHSRMNKLAKDELYQGRHVSLQELMDGVEHVSREHIRRLAQRLLGQSALSVTALGPVSRKSLESALN